jgi:predicted P-loop ATPase/GTPase
MKILAIEKEVEGIEWNNSEKLLEQEAQHVFWLYLSDCLREIYFTENKNAVLILETKNRKEAETLLGDFPLVKSGKIRFEIMELKPYTGYERIIKNKLK